MEAVLSNLGDRQSDNRTGFGADGDHPLPDRAAHRAIADAKTTRPRTIAAPQSGSRKRSERSLHRGAESRTAHALTPVKAGLDLLEDELNVQAGGTSSAVRDALRLVRRNVE